MSELLTRNIVSVAPTRKSVAVLFINITKFQRGGIVSNNPDNKPIGVVIAKFQVAKLHLGHIHLISHVRERHKDVLILIGYYPGVRNKRYQLKVDERIAMVEQTFLGQNFTVMQLRDNPISSVLWSEALDALIQEKFPGRKAVLYGSRDSFIPYYSGIFPTAEVAPVYDDSGTQWRAATEFPHSEDARRAIIWDQEHRPPFIYSTADLAIVDSKNRKVLLIGKKIHDGKLSFVGGHVDKTDATAEDTARREAEEEILDLRFGILVYVGSITIDDPRYKGTDDGVMTTFFVAEYIKGDPRPGDSDADSVQWVSYDDLLDILVPWHQPLGKLLLRKLEPTL